jgi:hypothetical protein
MKQQIKVFGICSHNSLSVSSGSPSSRLAYASLAIALTNLFYLDKFLTESIKLKDFNTFAKIVMMDRYYRRSSYFPFFHHSITSSIIKIKRDKIQNLLN